MMKRLFAVMLAVTAVLPVGYVPLAHADLMTIGGNFGGNRTYTSSQGPQVIVQGNPSGFRIGNGKEFAYRATASDTNGVDRVEIYVNDARIKTCYTNVCEYRNTYWTVDGNYRSIKFWTRATDSRGYTTDNANNPDYLNVDAYISTTADGTVTENNGSVLGTNDAYASLWTALEPNTTALNINQNTTYTVNAQDLDGLRQVDIYANGATIRTCSYGDVTTAQICYATISANNYSQGTNVSLNAKVTDKYGNTNWTNSTTLYRSNDGSNYNNGNNNVSPSIWLSFDLGNTTPLAANQTLTVTANAYDADGVKRIDFYIAESSHTGSSKPGCEFSPTTNTNQICRMTVSASDYPAGGSLYISAKATDIYGNEGQTNTSTMFKRANDNSNGITSGSVWTTLDPNSTTLYANQNVAYTANAQDNDGIQRIELYVNGFVRRTCEFGTNYSTVMCDTRLFANDYSQGTNVSASARVTDRFGNTTWSNTTTLSRANDGYVNNNNNNTSNAGVSAWSWFEPNANLARNASTQFRAGAWAERGLSSIELWVNGSVKRTCWFNTAYGNQSCDVTIYGGDYGTGTNISANVKATDRDGKTAWSDLRTITVTNDNGSTNGSNGTNVSISSDHSGTFRKNDRLTFWSTGSDNDGIDRTEIYVNAVRVRTCYGTASCSVTVGPFGRRADVSYAATVFDVHGNQTTTGYQHLTLVK